MSLKRRHASGKTVGGGSDTGGKVDRQELYDELKRLAASGLPFSPVDVALAIGAGEPQVSRALLGLAAEGHLEKVDVGKYRGGPGMAEMSQAEFLKAYGRASKVDSARQRDLSEIGRLKQNNDVMRQRLLAVIAERDHYLAVLKKHGIDPGPPPPPPSGPGMATEPMSAVPPARPAPAASEASPGPQGLAVPSPASEASPSGPGDTGAQAVVTGAQPGEPIFGDSNEIRTPSDAQDDT